MGNSQRNPKTDKDIVTPLALSSTDQIWLDLNLRCAWPDHGSLLPNLSPHRHFTAGAKLLAEQGDEFARAAWLPREGDLKSECFVVLVKVEHGYQVSGAKSLRL
jgi:hypothetical protein